MKSMLICLAALLSSFCDSVLYLAADNPDTVAVDNHMQVIDKFGNEVVLPIDVRSIRGFSKEGISPVRLLDGETAVIDTNGNMLFKTGRDSLSVFENGMSVFRDPFTNLWGVYASNGDRVVGAEYNWISSFCDGYAIAVKKNEEGISVLDREGKIVAVIKKEGISHDWGPPCEKLVPFRDTKTNRRGFIDFESKIVIPSGFVAVSPFKERLARVLVSTGNGLRAGFINTKGAYAIEPQYPIDSELEGESTDFSEGIAFVPSRTSPWERKAAIDSKGRTIFEVRAFSIEALADDRAAFFDSDAGKWGFIDSQGKVKVAPKYDKTSSFGGGLAVVPEEP